MTQEERAQIAALTARLDEYRDEVARWRKETQEVLRASEERLRVVETEFAACRAASATAREHRDREGGRVWEYWLLVAGAVTTFVISGLLGHTFGR